MVGGNNRCPCQDNYYETYTQICGSCDYSCKTCLGPTMCTSCDSATSHRVMNSNGLCVCQDTFFNNATNQVCLACHYSCRTCTTSNANGCTDCPTASFRTLNNGLCSCNQYYYDTGAPTCSKCLYPCAACNNAVNCTTCNAAKNRYMSTATMACLCAAGYFDNGL